MTIRNLDVLFGPKSIALFGASDASSSLGSFLARNLCGAGFGGQIMLVNPRHERIGDLPVFKDVADLPEAPDLAVIATPPLSVPDLISALGERGTKAAIVISAGFGEASAQTGRDLRQELLDAARPHLLRIIGPNCLGVMIPEVGLNASFAHLNPQAGNIAFVAQSGAIVTSMLDWATTRGVGFSHVVSLGNMSDVDFGDMLDYLANDRDTSAILLYIESITNARKFMSAARAAARMKPVIAVKAGRHAEGARAAASHTGALAGSDAVFDAVFRRTGILRVYSLQELFDAAETLSMTKGLQGNQLVIVTNGGGLGVLAADCLAELGGQLADLSPETLDRLNAVLPAAWSQANPIDIIGDAPPERYADTLQVLLGDHAIRAVLVINCPTAVASSLEAAKAVIGVGTANKRVQLLTSWVGDGSAVEARRLFSEHRIPTYPTPEQAVRAFMQVVSYRLAQDALMETPPSIPEQFTPDLATARASIEIALKDQRQWLTEPEAKDVLAAYGVPVVQTHRVQSADEAAAVAARLGGPVALKILSRDITHKSEVGGVALDLDGPSAVQQAAQEMLTRVSEAHPDAHIEGLSVQSMVHRPRAYELIIGMVNDAQFGPVLLFGQGGTAVEVINDKALGLPPLNMRLAREMISRTRIATLLNGYRDRRAINLDALALTLIKISQLISDVAEITELDINPLLVDEYGVIALDARIKVERTKQTAIERLAIRPYPKELEELIPLGDGRTLLLRPIRPEDEPSLHAAFAKLTPEEIYFRFFAPLKALSHLMAARFTQRDYDREMGLILTEPGVPGTTELYGGVSLSADPDNIRAEFALIIRHDMTGMGLGLVLMRRLIEYARQRGLQEIFGVVLYNNTTMLTLCELLGFSHHRDPESPGEVRVSLAL